jgi:uncharacterized protein YdhG (YjbR/CyaY superfamily)
MKSGFKTVDEYIGKQPPAVQVILRRIRSTVRKAVPEAEESISYQMPGYKLHGRPMFYFAAWKKHCSLYPGAAGVVEAFKDDLAPYEVSKGTISFSYSQRVPVRLISRLAKFRAKQVKARLGI